MKGERVSPFVQNSFFCFSLGSVGEKGDGLSILALTAPAFLRRSFLRLVRHLAQFKPLRCNLECCSATTKFLRKRTRLAGTA